MASPKEQFAEADRLYNHQKYKEALELLEARAAESEDVELIWRVMRLYFRLGKASKNKAEADGFAEKAYALSERGLKVNENNFGIQKVKSLTFNRKTTLSLIKLFVH